MLLLPLVGVREYFMVSKMSELMSGVKMSALRTSGYIYVYICIPVEAVFS